MKEEMRRAIATAAVVQISKKSVPSIYSYSGSKHIHMNGNPNGGYDYETGSHFSFNGSGIYHYGVGAHASLAVRGKTFSGYDYDTGSHFSGQINGGSVQIYDYGEGAYFNYSA